MRTQHDAAISQFDPQSQAYLASAVHAAGPDLRHAAHLVRALPEQPALALDLGCGAGHLAFALAPLVGQVVAADPSSSMLSTVSGAARERGLQNIRTQQTGAETLPFPDGRFDVVSSRYSAHHWFDLPRALREMRRVVKPGGYLLMIDLLGDESPLIDTHLQAMELMRDPSHVRDQSASQWRALLLEAGFRSIEEKHWPVRLEFASWIARMRTPVVSAEAIRRMQQGAPKEVQEGLAIEPDGSFTARTGLFWARAL
jgi:ubiquinone/menaquinone biosynthesis C-methylase UbiE